MNVVCYGAWRAASLLWQPSPGAWALTVACHAVFELAPNESPILAKALPLDPVKDDDERAFVEPWGPPAPIKRHPEVIVVGHAHAPPGRQVTSLVARLGVGDLEKLLHVHGETYFTPEGALAAPVVVARGQDHLAAKIRAVARDHDMPLVENKPLAQALFKGAEVGDAIPADLFGAVAELLAYLVRIRQLML